MVDRSGRREDPGWGYGSWVVWVDILWSNSVPHGGVPQSQLQSADSAIIPTAVCIEANQICLHVAFFSLTQRRQEFSHKQQLSEQLPWSNPRHSQSLQWNLNMSWLEWACRVVYVYFFSMRGTSTTLDVRGLDCYFMKHVHCVLSCFSCVQSLCLRGLWPTRLLSPWGSPGKNTGVGSHLLLQGIFPTHESKLCLLCLPAVAGGFLTIRASWEAPYEAHMKSKFSSETSMFKSNI